MIRLWTAGPSILMYHSIADNSDDFFTVPIDEFRKQISWLSAHGFELISLSSLLQSISDRQYRALSRKVVITFDDGCEDFLTNALPILLDHGATATVFLVTGMLGERPGWKETDDGERLMSEDEVRYIKTKGISLGSHTVSHAKLTLLNHDDLLQQLKDSHEALTDLGETFFAFAYPWGQWSAEVLDAVRACSYACAVKVGGYMRPSTVDKYLLPRITMTSEMGSRRFQSLMKRTSLEVEGRMRCGVAVRRFMRGHKGV